MQCAIGKDRLRCGRERGLIRRGCDTKAFVCASACPATYTYSRLLWFRTSKADLAFCVSQRLIRAKRVMYYSAVSALLIPTIRAVTVSLSRPLLRVTLMEPDKH